MTRVPTPLNSFGQPRGMTALYLANLFLGDNFRRLLGATWVGRLERTFRGEER